MSKTCNNCGRELAEEEQFCSSCVAPCEKNEEQKTEEIPDTVLWQKPQPTAEETVNEVAGETDDVIIPEKSSKRKKKSSFGRTIGAAALSLFLVVNLMLCFFVAAAIGISGSDISEFSVVVDGKEYSVDSIVEATVELDQTGVFGFINQLVDIDKGLEIDVGGNVYEIKLSQEILGLLGIDIPSTDEVSESICDSLNIALGTLLVVFIAVLMYLVLVVCMNVYSIYCALGKAKRANVLTGIMFLVCGATDLVFAIISAFNPELFGNRFICAIAGQMPTVASMFMASGVVGIVGCIIFLTGILAKSKE